MSLGTSVPFTRNGASHLGAISKLISPMHTENETVLAPIGTMKLGKNHVDEIMRHLQGSAEESAVVRFGSLPMRVGVAGLHR